MIEMKYLAVGLVLGMAAVEVKAQSLSYAYDLRNRITSVVSSTKVHTFDQLLGLRNVDANALGGLSLGNGVPMAAFSLTKGFAIGTGVELGLGVWSGWSQARPVGYGVTVGVSWRF